MTAVTKCETKKKTKYSQACTQKGMMFVPLVVDSLGAWGDEAIQVIKKIAGGLAARGDEHSEEQSRRIFQRLSVSLQRRNGAMFVDRMYET